MKAIMYHYVRPDDTSFPHFRHMTVAAFEAQLDLLSRRYRLISRTEFAEALETREPIKDGVVLTFDDGLKDHFTYVLPALLQRDTFGIFYIVASPYHSGKILDVHRAHLLLGRFGGKAIWRALVDRLTPQMLSHADVEQFRNETYRTQSNDDWTNQVKRTLNYYIDYRLRTAVIDALMCDFFAEGAPRAEEFYMTEAELREMHSAGMIVGSHTVNHPCMSKLTIAEQEIEIRDSFNHLEKVIGEHRPKTFCYPYGGFHSFTPETEQLLEQAGCSFSFNVEPRDITRADLQERRQALPRYACNAFPPLKTS